MSVLLWQHLGLPRPTASEVVMDELRGGGLMTLDLLRATTSIHMAELRHTLAEMKKEGSVFEIEGRWGINREKV